jgi:hypothetical protein
LRLPSRSTPSPRHPRPNTGATPPSSQPPYHHTSIGQPAPTPTYLNPGPTLPPRPGPPWPAPFRRLLGRIASSRPPDPTNHTSCTLGYASHGDNDGIHTSFSHFLTPDSVLQPPGPRYALSSHGRLSRDAPKRCECYVVRKKGMIHRQRGPLAEPTRTRLVSASTRVRSDNQSVVRKRADLECSQAPFY